MFVCVVTAVVVSVTETTTVTGNLGLLVYFYGCFSWCLLLFSQYSPTGWLGRAFPNNFFCV